ncbi:MAG: O-antigen ligase family protein [Armatimonadetes bacterium]|nr:O-antigen ligase family protein [Armatimonadota bacterium]
MKRASVQSSVKKTAHPSGSDKQAGLVIQWPTFRFQHLALLPLIIILLIAPVWAANLTALSRANPVFTSFPRAIGLTVIILLAGAMMVLAFPYAGRSMQWAPRGAVAISFTGLVAWTILSGFFTAFPYDVALNEALLVSALMVGWMISRTDWPLDYTFFVALALFFIASWVGGVGIREYLENWRGGNPSWRVFSYFVNPDFLAGFLVMTVPITIGLYLSAVEGTVRLWLGFGLILQCLCLVLTQSRFGLVVFVFVVGLFIVLGIRLRLFNSEVKRRGRPLAILAGLAALAAIGPVAKRFIQAGIQSYSAHFRVMTWIGVLKMIKASPIVGSGYGTFNSTYPPYAVVGTTEHAHNSFLQLAAEAGVPAMLLAAIGIAAVVYTVYRQLRSQPKDEVGQILVFDSTELLMTGALCGISGAILRNLFDSDFYVIANLFTFAALAGISLRLCHPQAPVRETGTLTRSTWVSRGFGSLVGLALLWVGLVTTIGRVEAYQAGKALTTGDMLVGYKRALVANPYDPAVWRAIAWVYVLYGNGGQAEVDINHALSLDPSAKTYFQHGQMLVRMNNFRLAIQSLQEALRHDSHNTQTMVKLAQTYEMADQPDAAMGVYQQIARQFDTPYAKIRAIPELVETNYAVAFTKLGDAALEAKNWQQAELDYLRSVRLLHDWWKSRHAPLYLVSIAPEKVKMLKDLYRHTLAQWLVTLQHAGASTNQDKAIKWLQELNQHQE